MHFGALFFDTLWTLAAAFYSYDPASVCPQHEMPSNRLLVLGKFFFDFA